MRDGKFYLKDGVVMINKNGKPVVAKGVPISGMLDTDIRVAAIIFKGSSLLLQHRIRQGCEYYVFAGGHKKVGEAEQDALIREIREELGLDIKRNSIKEMHRMENKQFGKEVYFYAEVDSFKQLLPRNPEIVKDEISESVFVDIHKLHKMNNVFPQEVAKILLDIYCRS